MNLLASVPRCWPGATVVVAATGPSLTQEQADACVGLHTVAVNDAHRLFPWAEVLYACDTAWWFEYDGVPNFAGQRWSSHEEGVLSKNDKRGAAERWGLTLVHGTRAKGFSLNPQLIHYGENSGFQGINLAILFGAARILLLGFDMHNIELPAKNLKRHFFGNHPTALRNTDPRTFIKNFNVAAAMLPPSIRIVNCTPDTALTCFERMPLEKALQWIDSI